MAPTMTRVCRFELSRSLEQKQRGLLAPLLLPARLFKTPPDLRAFIQPVTPSGVTETEPCTQRYEAGKEGDFSHCRNGFGVTYPR